MTLFEMFKTNVAFYLAGRLQATTWGKVNGHEERAKQLVEMQAPFIANVWKSLSPIQVAERLFLYETVKQ
jgi:hypothetical protein